MKFDTIYSCGDLESFVRGGGPSLITFLVIDLFYTGKRDSNSLAG